MSEKWIQWESAKRLTASYCIYAIMDTVEGFSILLFEAHNKKKMIKIVFANSVDAYRNTEESLRMKTIDDFDKRTSERAGTGCAFYKVQNSSYLKWLSEESYGIYSESLMHFSFITCNSILDIAAAYEPIIEFITIE